MVFPEGFTVDVATARTEYYEYPTALPTVTRSSIKPDLYRRDFTINILVIILVIRLNPTALVRCSTCMAGSGISRTKPCLTRCPLLSPAETFRLLAGQRVEALLFLLAKTSSDVARQQIVAYLDTYRYVKPALTGHTLRAMGLTPGPVFREFLNCVFEARLNGEVHDEAEERALVQRLLQKRP